MGNTALVVQHIIPSRILVVGYAAGEATAVAIVAAAIAGREEGTEEVEALQWVMVVRHLSQRRRGRQHIQRSSRWLQPSKRNRDRFTYQAIITTRRMCHTRCFSSTLPLHYNHIVIRYGVQLASHCKLATMYGCDSRCLIAAFSIESL